MAQFLLDTTGLTGGASCWTLNRNCLARCWEATGLPRGSSRWLLFIRRRAASVKKPRGKPVASSEAKAKLFVATHRDYHGTSPWHLKTPRTPRGISKHPGLPVASQNTQDSPWHIKAPGTPSPLFASALPISTTAGIRDCCVG